MALPDQGLSLRCMPEIATSAPVLEDSTLSDIATLSSASGSPTVSPGQTQQTLSTSIPQPLDPRESSSPIESIESQDILEDFILATLYLSEEFSNSLQNEAVCISSPPPQPVVTPALSHCLDPLQGSPDWSASHDQSHCASQVAEDRDVSVFNNENDAKHVFNIDRDESSEYSRPAKRLKRGHILDTISSTSQETVPRLSPESPLTRQPETPQQEANPESESIPVQGFLKLRYIGSEVVYCLELSQSHVSSLFAGGQTKGTRPSRQEGFSTFRSRKFSPEEDAFIVELKSKNYSWGMIEDRFAQQFPYRSKVSLQVHYCTKLKKLKEKTQISSTTAVLL
ncbi:hypothetical protein TSTA_000780 [Talaromyces stipitatus ATCC 10500]|uniref:Myb-like domain-containing protein n=1 Tax=Talaromyces stipitatus (strain ATCC 10500 / CBS 375.48 / QM 6759 / NRRL 1006) TaxID=441959 RepID=B8MSH8_TALSN|nr:uncharacterized protein TSTA_000780 [Talaromyces stipitatus ATCC 10500]EED12006.1 hypothetical protein TSTA_000780 [Talaromyces stipitatus ATCC 10500]